MVLRSVSNYTMQPRGETAAEHLLSERKGYTGMRASLEALYVTGSKVVDELTTKWDLYKDTIPGQ
jgi:purine nucleoside permease